MKDLLKTAQNKLEQACKGYEDMNSVSFWSGYLAAIRDVDRKLKYEGLDELED
jgi:hypothetical protein